MVPLSPETGAVERGFDVRRGWRTALGATTVMIAAAMPVSAERPDPNEVAAQRAFMSDQGRPPGWHLTQMKRLTSAIAGLKPQRPGVVDAYVVSIGLDSDPVFGREAAEAARVLARRYDADGRTLLLAAGGGAGAVPNGSPENLQVAIAAIAGVMDTKEDVLLLYTTSHGAPKVGLVYKDGDSGYGLIAPKSLGGILDGLGIKNRMVVISACYSGIFIPAMVNDDSVLITAASPVTTSFGCLPANDWTFFGDALINNAFRTPAGLDDAMGQALSLIGIWERLRGVTPSNPQFFVGPRARKWLQALEARTPIAVSAKVGRPAIEGR